MTVEERFPTLIQAVDFLCGKGEPEIAAQLLTDLKTAAAYLNNDESRDDSGS